MAARLPTITANEGTRVAPPHPAPHVLAHNARLAAQNDTIRHMLAQSDTVMAQTVAQIGTHLAMLDALLAASRDLLDSSTPNLNLNTDTDKE